ncbi:MAG: hypothetical protein KAH22_09395 [Thiotrichaceae bacterium]|nr:hypothetical protein [Thiotrichaceae bacterium]
MQLTQATPSNRQDTSLIPAQTTTSSNTTRTQPAATSPFAGNFQFILLILKLLSQLRAQNTNQPQTETEVNLSSAEKNIMQGLYAANRSGDTASNVMSVIDGSNADGKLSVGDRVVIKNTAGTIVSQRKLTTDDLYKINFRQSLVQRAESMARGGWPFTNKVVNIANSSLNQPFTRRIEGNRRREKVLEKNDFWEVVERNGNRMLLQRTHDDSGKKILASNALKDLIHSRADYAFDCASPMSILNLLATMDTVGDDHFNKNAGRLLISSWLDPYDANSSFDGGFVQHGRAEKAGVVKVDGVFNLKGELALFDTSKGDELRPGSTYYFEKPGDNTSEFQGWNAVYLGKNDNNIAKFWIPSIGIEHVPFKEGTWLPTEGTVKGYYLGSSVGSPDFLRLGRWDR